MRRRRVALLNARFDALTLTEAVEAIVQLSHDEGRGWIATVNVAVLMMMRDDDALQSYVNRAAVVLADGQPLIWLARLCGQPLPERVTGVDMIARIAERAGAAGLRIGLLGSSAANIERVREALTQYCEPRSIVYAGDGYFAWDQAADRVRAIRESRVDILVVGMGVPRQEAFIERWWDELGCDVAIGVGGSFEVIAGTLKRAPIVLQRAGLEWLYRLIQEPRRLFRRYLTTNLRFLALVPGVLLTSFRMKNDKDL